MSEQARGPGWWIASDGKWYPPETHPDYRPPPPPPSASTEHTGSRSPAEAPRNPAPRKSQRRGVWSRFRGLPAWVQVAVGILLLVIVIAAASGPDDKAEQVTSGTEPTTQSEDETGDEVQTTPAPRPTTSTTAAGPKTTFGDGTHRVGTDIAPGTYRNSGGTGCYWERLSGFGGSFGDIIANGNASGSQPVVVTISTSDAGFTSRRCGTWSPA